MKGAPLLLLIWGCMAFGVGLGMLLPRPAPPANPERDCIVIDLRTKPGPGRIIPAEPEA